MPTPLHPRWQASLPTWSSASTAFQDFLRCALRSLLEHQMLSQLPGVVPLPRCAVTLKSETPIPVGSSQALDLRRVVVWVSLECSLLITCSPAGWESRHPPSGVWHMWTTGRRWLLTPSMPSVSWRWLNSLRACLISRLTDVKLLDGQPAPTWGEPWEREESRYCTMPVSWEVTLAFPGNTQTPLWLPALLNSIPFGASCVPAKPGSLQNFSCSVPLRGQGGYMLCQAPLLGIKSGSTFADVLSRPWAGNAQESIRVSSLAWLRVLWTHSLLDSFGLSERCVPMLPSTFGFRPSHPWPMVTWICLRIPLLPLCYIVCRLLDGLFFGLALSVTCLAPSVSKRATAMSWNFGLLGLGMLLLHTKSPTVLTSQDLPQPMLVLPVLPCVHWRWMIKLWFDWALPAACSPAGTKPSGLTTPMPASGVEPLTRCIIAIGNAPNTMTWELHWHRTFPPFWTYFLLRCRCVDGHSSLPPGAPGLSSLWICPLPLRHHGLPSLQVVGLISSPMGRVCVSRTPCCVVLLGQLWLSLPLMFTGPLGESRFLVLRTCQVCANRPTEQNCTQLDLVCSVQLMPARLCGFGLTVKGFSWSSIGWSEDATRSTPIGTMPICGSGLPNQLTDLGRTTLQFSRCLLTALCIAPLRRKRRGCSSTMTTLIVLPVWRINRVRRSSGRFGNNMRKRWLQPATFFNRCGSYNWRLEDGRFRPASVEPQILSLSLSVLPEILRRLFLWVSGEVLSHQMLQGCLDMTSCRRPLLGSLPGFQMMRPRLWLGFHSINCTLIFNWVGATQVLSRCNSVGLTLIRAHIWQPSHTTAEYGSVGSANWWKRSGRPLGWRSPCNSADHSLICCRRTYLVPRFHGTLEQCRRQNIGCQGFWQSHAPVTLGCSNVCL